ncbi:MAG: molybdopterin biosynthesis protein [Candidatus Heimdallarchaeota archaeon]|nr:molybdopterin biosynthesis protein [Candidatus Heimdallarchaeota archaeon]
MRKVFRELVEAEEARNIFYRAAKPELLGNEKIPLMQSLGRVLSRDIHSPINVPPFDRASMDGFAVQSADLVGAEEDNPITLKVIGEIKAGQTFESLIEAGTCTEIATGAPMPSGADAVVMVEYSSRSENFVSITSMVTPGENIMSAGADIQLGERVLSKYTQLSSRELAVLAAIGTTEVDVIRKPKIGIFSSGDEVMEAGQALLPGKLYDINSISIASNIIEQGGDPVFLGIVSDTYEDLEKALKGVMGEYDLLLISGGTSAGMGDMLYQIVDDLGKPGLLVHGIKVKPGKPTILAVCDGNPIIGLPGYPASALSIYKLFVIPYIRILAGLPAQSPGEVIKAVIKQRLRSVMGRYEFKPVNLIRLGNEFIAYPVPGGSGAITSIALADGFVEIDSDVQFILPETEIKVSLLSETINLPDLQIIGSHCIALAQLQTLFADQYPQYTSRSIAVGSTGGVAAIRRKEAHIAGIHLLNEQGEYNRWLLSSSDNIEIIKGYNRNQGLIIKKGNPKGIHGLKDLSLKGIRMINRNPGSGTRILFDLLLKENEINPEMIIGYDNFVNSHSNAAMAVKSPYIDVAMGIEAVIDEDLEFINIREEEYDFLISKDLVQEPVIQAFIQTLDSDEFTQILTSITGYSRRT